MHKPASALAIFLLLTISFAAGEAPQLSSSLSAAVSESGAITATGGDIRSLALNISIPSSAPSAPYQVVDAGEPMLFDSDGNAYLAISTQTPTRRFTYSKQISVQSVARSTPALPKTYSVPSQYLRFSAATNRTQSNDEGIRKLAQQITSSAQTPFEKVALLAIYVNRNMRYEEAMVGQEKDALWVKGNMYGVCTEYSTLFVALCRSIGIPARYVSGYVYSDKYASWMGHAWAEAYIGQWVPVDPTWFEVGALDAMHIEDAKSAEFSQRDTLAATVSSQSVRLDWDTGAKSGAVAGNIKTLGTEYSEPSGAYLLEAVAQNISAGGSTIVYLSMNGTDFRVVPVTLAGCVGSGSMSLDEGEKYIILQPGKTSTLSWVASASGSFPAGYTYRCPLTLNSPYLAHRTITIGIDPSRKAAPSFAASLSETSIYPGKQNSVLLTLPRQLQGRRFTAVLPDGTFSAQPAGAAAEIPFTSSAGGTVQAFVGSDAGGATVLNFSSGGESGFVSIDAFGLPETLVAGAAATAMANVSAKHYPADITLDFSFGGVSQQEVATLAGPSSLAFNFTPPSQGAFTAKLGASLAGSKSEASRAANVLLQPTLSIGGVESLYINGTLYTRLTFLSAGDPSSPAAAAKGAAYSADGPIVILLPLGKQDVLLSWQDAAGNKYSSTEKITVSQPSMASALAGSVRSAGGCPLALIFLSVAFSTFLFRR